MKLAIKDLSGKQAGEIEIQFPVIPNGRGTQAVHDAVVAHRAAVRSGTRSTKTMGEVAGSGKKPWRQKGTGRARAGSFRSPLWVGGGVVHGPKPRDYTKKINKNVRALAFQKALSERVKANEVVVVDDLKLSSPKTRELVKVMDALELPGTTLFVVSGADRNVELAARNIPYVGLTTASLVNTYELLKYDTVVFTKAALEQVGQRVGKE